MQQGSEEVQWLQQREREWEAMMLCRSKGVNLACMPGLVLKECRNGFFPNTGRTVWGRNGVELANARANAGC